MTHKKLLTNLLFAAVVLAIAAVLLLVRNAHSSGSKLRAELIYGDNNTSDVSSAASDVYKRQVPPALWTPPARTTSVRASAGCPTKTRPPPACPPARC